MNEEEIEWVARAGAVLQLEVGVGEREVDPRQAFAPAAVSRQQADVVRGEGQCAAGLLGGVDAEPGDAVGAGAQDHAAVRGDRDGVGLGAQRHAAEGGEHDVAFDLRALGVRGPPKAGVEDAFEDADRTAAFDADVAALGFDLGATQRVGIADLQPSDLEPRAADRDVAAGGVVGVIGGVRVDVAQHDHPGGLVVSFGVHGIDGGDQADVTAIGVDPSAVTEHHLARAILVVDRHHARGFEVDLPAGAGVDRAFVDHPAARRVAAGRVAAAAAGQQHAAAAGRDRAAAFAAYFSAQRELLAVVVRVVADALEGADGDRAAERIGVAGRPGVDRVGEHRIPAFGAQRQAAAVGGDVAVRVHVGAAQVERAAAGRDVRVQREIAEEAAVEFAARGSPFVLALGVGAQFEAQREAGARGVDLLLDHDVVGGEQAQGGFGVGEHLGAVEVHGGAQADVPRLAARVAARTARGEGDVGARAEGLLEQRDIDLGDGAVVGSGDRGREDQLGVVTRGLLDFVVEGARGVDDVDVEGVEQPLAAVVLRPPTAGREVGRAGDVEEGAPRGLDETAVAAAKAAEGRNHAVAACDAVGPDDDLAAVALAQGIGAHGGAFAQIGLLRGAGLPTALARATDANAAAAFVAGGVEHGVVRDGDEVAQDVDLAAALAAPVARGVDQGVARDLDQPAALGSDRCGESSRRACPPRASAPDPFRRRRSSPCSRSPGRRRNRPRAAWPCRPRARSSGSPRCCRGCAARSRRPPPGSASRRRVRSRRG